VETVFFYDLTLSHNTSVTGRRDGQTDGRQSCHRRAIQL